MLTVDDCAFRNDGGRIMRLDLTQTLSPKLIMSSRFVFDTRNDKRVLRLLGKYAVNGTEAISSSIGSDDDPNAVLDSKFRVRGVEGLRVVDASAFPRAPGAFPVLAVFLLSEKAALDILSTQ